MIAILVFLSPLYSLYKIGTAVKEKDKNTLSSYIVWPEIQVSVKELDNPIEGVLEDIKKIGGTIFGEKAIDIAIKKVVTPEGVIKLIEISEKRNTNKKKETSSNEKGISSFYDGYGLEELNFISLSDMEATVLTPDGDIYFKMRFVFPTWYLYMVKSQKLTEEISKKVEDSVNLLKNLNRKLNDIVNQIN